MGSVVIYNYADVLTVFHGVSLCFTFFLAQTKWLSVHTYERVPHVTVDRQGVFEELHFNKNDLEGKLEKRGGDREKAILIGNQQSLC